MFKCSSWDKSFVGFGMSVFSIRFTYLQSELQVSVSIVTFPRILIFVFIFSVFSDNFIRVSPKVERVDPENWLLKRTVQFRWNATEFANNMTEVAVLGYNVRISHFMSNFSYFRPYICSIIGHFMSWRCPLICLWYIIFLAARTI